MIYVIEPMTTTDESLIERIELGDDSAFELLVKRYQQKVFQTCIGFVHNEEDAADLTQEVFIRVYKRLHTFKGNSTFSTWIYRISMNMSLNFLRKRKVKHLFTRIDQNEGKQEIISEERTDQNILRRDEKKKIQRILQKLTVAQRKAFVLSHYQELSNQELADVMEISIKAAESLLYRARTRLREILTENNRFD